MNNAVFGWLSLVGLGLLPSQTPEPLLKSDFKTSESGWVAYGKTAKVSLASGLKFDYAIQKGELNALVLPAEPDSLTKAKSFRFRVKADANTFIAVGLQEVDGGRYVATFLVPKDTWQTVELSPLDFGLSQEPNDPKDPDGKLDLDRVNGIAIADIGQLFYQSGDRQILNLLDVTPGAHSLVIDDFSVGTDSVPASAWKSGSDVRIDTFVHPQIAWVALGGVNLSLGSNPQVEGRGLKCAYKQAPATMAALSRSVAAGLLDGAKSISMPFATTQAAKLVVQVEQTDGGKFNMPVDLAENSSRQVSLNLAEFKTAEDSKNPAAKMQPEKIKNLSIVDTTGMLGGPVHDNTLWIGPIRAAK